MARALVGIFALIIIAGVGVYGIEAALETAGDDRDIENETFTPTSGTVIQLDNSDRENAFYEHQVAVFNQSDVRMVEGTDYTWFSINGTVKPLSGGDLAGDSSANISYGFAVTTEDQRQLTSILAMLPTVVGLAIPALAFVLFVAFVRG